MEFYYDEMVLETFLKNQERLFDEPIASSMEEADEFLNDCMAVVFNSVKEIRDYWEESGMDAADLSDAEIEDELEVFALADGRYLVVEA